MKYKQLEYITFEKARNQITVTFLGITWLHNVKKSLTIYWFYLVIIYFKVSFLKILLCVTYHLALTIFTNVM